MTENKKTGYIMLYRSLLNNLIFTSEKGLKVFIWCLLKANHQKKELYMNNKKITVNEGEFITGSFKAREDLNMAVATIWYWLNILEKEGIVEIKKTNKYSLVKIKKWGTYQAVCKQNENRMKTERKQNETNNNVNNVKNVKNTSLQARANVKFPINDYNEIIKKYEYLKGVKFNGNEYKPLQQAIKSMFMSNRTKDQIIKCMEALQSSDLPHWQSWNINTVQKQIPLFVSGNLTF